MTLKLQMNRLKSLILSNRRFRPLLCVMPAAILVSLFWAPLVFSQETTFPILDSSSPLTVDQTSFDIPVQVQVSVPLQLDQNSSYYSIFVFTNQPAEKIVDVAFYVRTADTLDELPVQLYLLGVDTDGQDGWSILVKAEELAFLDPCHIVVMAKLADSQTVWAESASFYSPKADLLVTPILDSANPSAVPLAVLPLGKEDSAALLATSREDVPPAVDSSPLRQLVGAVGEGISGLWAQNFWDSANLPNVLADGIYDVSILSNSSNRTSIGTTSSESLIVQQDEAPTVSVIAPAPFSSVSASFEVILTVEDVDSAIERVDVYIYQDASLCPDLQGEQPYPGEMTWVGTDSSNIDGWRIQVRLSEDWQGNDWYIFAVAWDSTGLAGWCSTSEPFTILAEGQSRAVVVSPLAGQIISGSTLVQVAVPDNPQDVSGLELYARNDLGLGIYVGELTQVGSLWQIEWDTAELPDGEYGLYVICKTQNDSNTLSPTQLVQLQNDSPRLALISPRSGSSVSQQISINAKLISGACSEISVQMTDEQGETILLPNLAISEGVASGEFSTAGMLDGAYMLSLTARDEHTGETTEIQQEIRLVSDQRMLSLALDDTGESIKGIVPVDWNIGGQAVEGDVTLQYSPDTGAHWVILASGELDTPYLWDTRDVADSTNGILRLVVPTESGILTAEHPVTVNNVNEAPAVSFSSPLADSIISSECLINWQSYDTDGDALSAQIEYRAPGEDWIVIARQSEDKGQFIWSTRNIAPGTYQLRIKVFDPEGAVGEAQVYPIYVSGNSAPVVRLIAPLENIHLEDEAIVLWNTYDEDGDELTISIEYSYDAGKTWLPLAEDLENTGYYLWQFSYLPAGDQYRLRVIADDGQATGSTESGGLLTIGTPTDPAFALVYPAEGDQLEGSVLLCWQALGEYEQATPVSLMVRQENSDDWQLITEDCSQTNFGVWDATGLSGDYQLVLGVFGRTSGRYQLLDVVDEVSVVIAPIATEPSVTLLSPLAGDLVNNEVTVSWETSGFSTQALAQIDLWTAAQPTWTRVASVEAGLGHCVLNKDALGTNISAMVRVTIVDGEKRVSDTMEGAFCILGNAHLPILEVTSPTSDGALINDKLAWNAFDPDGDRVFVSIELSSDNGFSWETLHSGLEASGTYDVSDLPLGDRSRIRISATDGLFSTSWISQEIDLSSRPHIDIETPAAGERWRGLEIVRWQSSYTGTESLEFDVQVSSDGLNWDSIASTLPNEESLLFDTTELVDGWYWLRIVIAGETTASEIAGPFQINNTMSHQPLASIVVATEGLPMNGLERVAWSVTDQDNDLLSITLAYSLDEGATWSTFAIEEGSTGGVLWDTRDLPNTDRLWLRLTADDGEYTTKDYLGPVAISNEGSPSVNFLTPSESVWTGIRRVSWEGAFSEKRDLIVRLDMSYDGGRTWRTRATDKALTDSYLWDTRNVQTGTDVRFRLAVIESGVVVAYAHSDAVIVWGNTTLEPLD